ncbi:MAG: ribulose-phosphate 3-epimerase [Gemmatimonadales bacterium]
MTPRIAPSVLSADLDRLAEQIAQVEQGGAEWLHVDVMDGRFVPNLTFGAPVIRALGRLTRLPLDVHLMVVEPERYLEEYADLGVANFTFHPEATIHVDRHLARIHERGMKAGLALNPASPLALIEEVLDEVDLVLVMTVNPGFGGQDYIEAGTDKIRRVRQLLTRRNSPATLEVDGGITVETIRRAWDAGADTFVVGTAVFGAPDPGRAVVKLKEACQTPV